jgi:mono/diheme cytochrome c family protein
MKAALAIAFLVIGAAGCGKSASAGDRPGTPVARPEVAAEYKGRTAPTNASADAGERLFGAQCASCHGTGGNGDGPVGKALNPRAADLTDASMHDAVGDDYLYWRISEGGAINPFHSAMTPFKSVLTEQERWDIVAYLRNLKQ